MSNGKVVFVWLKCHGSRLRISNWQSQIGCLQYTFLGWDPFSDPAWMRDACALGCPLFSALQFEVIFFWFADTLSSLFFQFHLSSFLALSVLVNQTCSKTTSFWTLHCNLKATNHQHNVHSSSDVCQHSFLLYTSCKFTFNIYRSTST